MRVVSTIDFSILDNGNYLLNTAIVYHSKRYNKTIVCPVGMESDGATGAFDIASRAWWIHDRACSDGCFSDGTPMSNWQCSTLLYDVLKEEGRTFQSGYWRISTWLFGGGKARKNGMLSAA